MRQTRTFSLSSIFANPSMVKNTLRCLNRVLVILCLLLTAHAQLIRAQDGAVCSDEKAEARVDFRVLKGGVSQPFTVNLNGVSVGGTGTECSAIPEMSGSPTMLTLYKTYEMTIGPGICWIHLAVRVPEGYRLFINDLETTEIYATSPSSTWRIRVEPACSCGCDKENLGSSGAGARNGSIVWETALGKLSDGRTSAPLSIREKYLTPLVYTPAALIYSPPGFTDEVDVVYLNPANKNLGFRQIKTPEGLADIIVVSSTEYDVRLYSAPNVGAKTGGLYPVTGLPMVTWKFKNPNQPSSNRLQISKTQNGITETSEYTWDGATNTLTLTKNGGTWIDSKTTAIDGVTGDRTETQTVKDNFGVVSSKTSKTYHTFPWGDDLIREIVDPDGAALTTLYAYYENSAEIGKYTSLKSVINPDGSWEKYDYGWVGYRTVVMRPWKDQNIATADYWNSRTTSYQYAHLWTYHLGVTNIDEYVSSTEELIQGQVVQKRTLQQKIMNDPYNVDASAIPYGVTEIETVYSSNATLGARTITTRYDAFEPAELAWLANRVSTVIHPDGRQDTYSYEKGTFVVNANPALSQFTPNTSGSAERQIVVHGTTAAPDGVVNKTTRDVSITDERGRGVYQETHVYTGSGYERVGWSAQTYNDRGQLTQSRQHNGTVTTSVYVGDQKTSETDESGVETGYTYDVYNRLKTRTKKGIAAAGGFPAQVDIVTTNNYDTMGRIKSEVVAGGGLALTSSKIYDVAGRTSSQTDATGLTTNYAYTNGGRTTTVTMPNGATQITDSYLDGQTWKVTGTGTIPITLDYGTNGDGTRWTKEFVGTLGTNSLRWTKTTVNWMGNTVKTEKPSFVSAALTQTSTYNEKGQLISQSVLEGASVKRTADKLYEYDNLGNQIRSGLDVDGSGNLTVASTDRMAESDSYFEKIGSDWFRTSVNKTYLTDWSATATVTGTSRERLNNFPLAGGSQTVSESVSIDSAGNQTKSTADIDRVAKKATQTTDTPDSATNAISISINGLAQSSLPSTPQNATAVTYDALGRQKTVVSPSSGTVTKNYDAVTGRITSESHGANTTSYSYYAAGTPGAGKLSAQTNPNNKKVYFNYDVQGRVTQTWGDATYPLETVYDAYGQQSELRTFRAGTGWTAAAWPGGTTGTADVTKWIYQEKTGLLTQKQDAALKGATYTYDALGRVEKRTWARLVGGAALTSTYGYDARTGEMSAINYSDATPDVTFGYDRAGRQTTLSDAAGIHTRTFNNSGQMLSEQITSGILDGVKIQPGYDALWRRQSLQTFYNATALTSQTYGYDTSGRLQTVASGAQTATYAYYPTTGQPNTTTFTGGTNTARSYDALGRLQSITNTPSGGGATSFAYTYNNLNQRTRTTREDASYWSYSYNDRGELLSGKKYWSDASLVAGQQGEYVYDNLGNRTSTKAGGDAAGTNQRTASYTSNNLNQYASRTNPGAIDVTGTAATGATVTVNNQGVYRKGSYFQLALSVNNASNPVYQQITAVGAKTASGTNGEDAVSDQTGNVYVPSATETFVYDLDGNLLSDGRWQYVWDAENRLISMTAIAAAPTTAKKRLEFAYDFASRRIQKKVYNWNNTSSSYQLAQVTKFVNDGWDTVAELNANNTLVKSYVWSGGQLLSVKDGSNTYYAGYDGNENVTSLVKASTGTISANYEFDSFGQTIQSTGDYAAKNPFRFSSKYWDAETNLIYYGFRYYNSQTGRWIGRDPSGESSGSNLYGFLSNDGINSTDFLGLWKALGRWRGNWGVYEPSFVRAEKGDCLPRLAEIITNDSRDWELLGIKGPSISAGRTVDIQKLLKILEGKLRDHTVDQSQYLKARFPDPGKKDVGDVANADIYLNPLTPSQKVDRFFDQRNRPENEWPLADCTEAALMVQRNALKSFLQDNSVYNQLGLRDDNYGSSTNSLFETKKGIVGAMLKGDNGWLPNYSDYGENGEDRSWAFENSILKEVGRERVYWAHPFGEITQTNLIKNLASVYKGSKRGAPFDDLTEVDITFLNVSRIAMRVLEIKNNKRR